MLSAQSLSALSDKISSYGYEIKATALIRSPYSEFCSALQQRIQRGHYCNLISFDNSVPNSFETASYGKSKIIQKLKSVFGESVYFHCFENACTHSHGPVGFLLEEFLNQDPSSFKYKKTNESLSNLSARIQNEFNAIYPPFVKGSVNHEFRRFPFKVNKKLALSGKFLLTEIEYALIEEFVRIETENLSQIIGLDFSVQSLKFSNPIF